MSVQAPERPPVEHFPTNDEYTRHLDKRSRRASWFRIFCLAMLAIAVLALATLLYTIINDSFGQVAIVNQNQPEDLLEALGYDPETTALNEITYDEMVGLLESTVSSGVGRRLERDQRFYEDRLVFESEEVWAEICTSDEPPTGCSLGPRDQANVYALVQERVVQPDIIAANELVPSILRPEEFVAEVEGAFGTGRFPDYTVDQVEFEWRAWFSWSFVTSPASATPEIAGIRTAILGSAWLVLITVLFAVPVGVGAAIYLVEYARPTRLNSFIQTNINNLAGVPSIVYGMLGLAVFVRVLEPLTSGDIFTGGASPSDNGRTILAAGLTLGLLTLPVVIISAQEALKAVPDSLRQAGMALGATRWQTVRSQILPVAMPGVLTGTILAVARAVGETAPLILVGAASFITVDPSGPFSKFTALPIQIFQWTSFPQEEFRHLAAAASIALLILLLTLNAAAVILRNRFSRRVE
ncbi:MAG TPA: phosphate ABC transporter permease PstA [Acidimicrobiia bacterium]|nr:phosphate ABC transporter permease PstA [Acidimicrobiia bacterium]